MSKKPFPLQRSAFIVLSLLNAALLDERFEHPAGEWKARDCLCGAHHRICQANLLFSLPGSRLYSCIVFVP